MVKTKFKKAVSLVLAAVMSLTAFMGIGATTAFAAVGEKADVYLVDYPRSGDTNNNGEWGHGNLNYMNGWKGLSTKYTGLRAMGSYSGNIAYCIEPGTGQRTGDTLTEKDENFFNNISDYHFALVLHGLLRFNLISHRSFAQGLSDFLVCNFAPVFYGLRKVWIF